MALKEPSKYIYGTVSYVFNKEVTHIFWKNEFIQPYSWLSTKVDQIDSSSKSDRAFKGGSKMNSVAGPLVLKLLCAILTEIGRT